MQTEVFGKKNQKIETEGAGRPRGLYTFMLIRPMGSRSQRPQGVSKTGSVTDESETNVSCSCESFSEINVLNVWTIFPSPFLYLLNPLCVYFRIAVSSTDGWARWLKRWRRWRKQVLFLLTLRMCGNMGMHKVNGKVALWMQFHGPSRWGKLGKACFRFCRSDMVIADAVVCCLKFGKICSTSRCETVVVTQHCDVVGKCLFCC